MPVSRSFLILLTVGLLLAGSLASAGGASAASSAGQTTSCSNGVDNTPGLGLICRITVVNTVTSTGGSAKVTIRECHGAAGDPTAACAPLKVVNLNQLVTTVTQCNDSINGGGGTLRCSVQVTNRFVGLSTGATAATVNQCVGSGDGIANNCDPFPATTSGATITQCNGSANGGTLVRLECTATGTKPSSHGVRINQCNGSANGGGALVICSSNITNIHVASSGGGSQTAPPTPPDTSTTAAPAPTEPNEAPLVLFAVLAIAFVAWATRTSRRRIRTH
jgi:hypothetical protein